MENLTVGKMEIPVVTNVTADYVCEEDVKEILKKQVSSPVLWQKCMEKMIADGFDTFIEIGPGKTLCGFAKKINADIKAYNVEDMASLEKVVEELKLC